jgi:hypothetical protein
MRTHAFVLSTPARVVPSFHRVRILLSVCCLATLLSLSSASLKKSVAHLSVPEASGSYRAAAVDYAPVVMAKYSQTPISRAGALRIMLANLGQLNTITANAASARSQIIVFPVGTNKPQSVCGSVWRVSGTSLTMVGGGPSSVDRCSVCVSLTGVIVASRCA